MSEPTTRLQREDIQALLRTAFGRLRHARYLLLAVDDAEAARDWLRDLLASGLVLSAAQVGQGAPAADAAVSLGFSAAGLEALGHAVDAGDWPFPSAFRAGMASTSRARLLREPDRNWLWGDVPGPDPAQHQACVHMLLAVFGRGPGWPVALPHPVGRGWRSAGPDVSACPAYIERRDAASQPVAFEPFGFRDGLSQPVIPQMRDPEAPVRRHDEFEAPASDHELAPGEFVLGYRNQYGEAAYAPDLPGWAAHAASHPGAPERFGCNGSYLAARQIRQQAEDFIAAHGQPRDGGPSDAELMMGRRRDEHGTPLQVRPRPPSDPNAFRFRVNDLEGFQCPRGAHVRRANPRDLLGEDRAAGLEMARLHRLLRRGRTYARQDPCPHQDCGHADHRRLRADGAPLDADTACGEGLMFLACNADLERQFEFVQQRWIANPRFGELENEVDPIVGGREEGLFTVPGLPRGRVVSLDRSYTQAVGGGYFFVPGLSALAFLAAPRHGRPTSAGVTGSATSSILGGPIAGVSSSTPVGSTVTK